MKTKIAMTTMRVLLAAILMVGVFAVPEELGGMTSTNTAN